MKMSKEMAVRLHRMMWSDMQRELGDRPSGYDRHKFKREWVKRNFPGEAIANNCWLCEYASSVADPSDTELYCKYCPISWPDRQCNTLDFSYTKEPISEILALPAKNESFDKKAVNIHDLPIDIVGLEHIRAIKEKAVEDFLKEQEGKTGEYLYNRLKKKLADFSGIDDICPVEDHVKRIQEKAVDEYFEKRPAAKLATMDVDQAFKQYADEQKAPIFKQLAAASGLSSSNESVSSHISLIRDTAKQNGRMEKCKEIFDELSESSGLSKGNWCLSDHVKAIQANASNEKDLIEIRKKLKDAIGALKLYQSTLSYESNLPSSAPVAAHIKRIREYAFHDGKIHERERIMDKIGEMLNDKPTGTCKDI